MQALRVFLCNVFCCPPKKESVSSFVIDNPVSPTNNLIRDIPTSILTPPVDPSSLAHINELALYIATHRDVFTLANTIATSF